MAEPYADMIVRHLGGREEVAEPYADMIVRHLGGEGRGGRTLCRYDSQAPWQIICCRIPAGTS